ncbi:putative SNF2 family N-terminal domain containing protein [Neospora caninum Liverpool]|uniref:Putative SNF2 family N-terminal domain containing protein n=1 Tax=Neospora caninum (strain Liverpool) TaxID=572307 RepID=F0VKQ8_NEOCL|nr:putative SNF2 family N-terminal domain containing protein [Neospora caninum Liverpool]CBZ54659.1 putative SNF2 family N-terminal domain containing protein [Neospora caninum Liverpool]|eukprot:XP_003884689.1 putative SNF2 family N-terminal domain containing protein [Neospora caninum Liverpool]
MGSQGVSSGSASRAGSGESSRSSSCARDTSPPRSSFSSSRLRAQAERQAAAAAAQAEAVASSSSSSTSTRGGGNGSSQSAAPRPTASASSGRSTKFSGPFFSQASSGAGRKRGGMWCYICRDSMQRGEENTVECTACPKRFHLECLQQEGVIQPGERVSPDDWMCPQCLEEHEEDEIQNDERCFICKRKEPEDEEEDRLLMCDGCPNSYHMRSCLKLTIEPDEEKWFCPECNPSGFKQDEIRRLGRGRAGARGSEGRGEIVNSSTCYVCQRPGKLLGCDFCVNSFHPTCLVDVDWDSIGEEWECPVCKGRDPLANQMHKRWSRAEIEAKRKERIKCLERIRVKTTRYRNRFLLVHQKDLGPFVNQKILNNLAKSFRSQMSANAAGKRRPQAQGGRLQVERSIQDLLESLEDEAAEESAKFVKRAYRACRHPSGRKIEGVPLREGISLKPHQEEGVEWLLRSFMTGGGILADEMGLGKTIQTLCFLSYLNAMKLEGPHLIVVPLSTVGNWMREVHRFTPSLTHIKICGSRAERQHAMEDRLAQKGLYDLYITTYETVKSEEEFFVETIPHWQCIVLDEAHRIKNASGAIRHALDRVIGNMRLLLTGTPLQNNAAELFTLINFLMPDVFRDSQVIEQAFLTNPQGGGSGANASNKKDASGRGDAGPKSQNGKKAPVVEVDQLFRQEDLEAIRNLLDRVMLRRLKEQAIALPKKMYHSVWLPLSAPAASWYERLLRVRALQEAGKDKLSTSSYRKMLGLVIKMRIICAHPKALCARESQMQRLQAFFVEENMEMQTEVIEAAREVQRIEGEAHILCSAKLSFLDKLMRHLHELNCKYVPGYEKDYENHRRETATYKFYKRHEEVVKEETAAGRKPPRRPKRNELGGIEEFQRLLRAGHPRLAGVPAVEDPDFLEEGMYPAELQLPQPIESSASSLRGVDGVGLLGGRRASVDEDVAMDEPGEGKAPSSSEEVGTEGKRCAPQLSKSGFLSSRGPGDGSASKRKESDEDEDQEEGDVVKSRDAARSKKKRGLVILDDEEDDMGTASTFSSSSPAPLPSSLTSSTAATSPAAEDASSGARRNSSSEHSDELRPPQTPAERSSAPLVKNEDLGPNGLQASPRGLCASPGNRDEALSTAYCTSTPSSTKDNGRRSGRSSDGAQPVCPLKKEGGEQNGGAKKEVAKEEKEEALMAAGAKEAKPEETEPKGEGAETDGKGGTGDEAANGNDKQEFVIDRTQPKAQRLLVFTQFQLVLDELEAYCHYRGWKYLRLDGSTNKFVRELDIRDFNSENSTYFVYLISTRAGGLGINLTAANHVVLYDHDWNPFIDLQAIDRAHRIGQQRAVHVWSLVNEWTVEERMAFRREQKLRLDKLLVQNQHEEALEDEDEEQQKGGDKISTDEIRKLMLHGRKAIVEVAAKNPVSIAECSLEELTERQRLPLPELTDGAGSAVGDGSLLDSSRITTNEDGEEDELGSRDEENMVDIDEVMNEEAEEQNKQAQLVDSADTVLPDAGNVEMGGSSGGPRDGAEEGCSKTTSENECGSARESERAREGDDGRTPAGEQSAQSPAEGRDAGEHDASRGPGVGRTKGKLENELQRAGVLWRSERERKKPIAVYVPQEFGQREERKKIKHEQKCFLCGNGKDFEHSSVDADGNTTKASLGELVYCSGCPRAYHRVCEGLPRDVKKSWRCRWHECCLCFRKTSQCGNMLIHCAKCPTSFCYDCFPPDYCRHNVSEEYYSYLRQRGMNVTPQNWILLLCSRCKAVEEQQTRRRLTKEEKEQEKLQQKELRQQQKELHHDLDASKRKQENQQRRQECKQRAEEERQFQEAKQQIDSQDAKQEEELRQAYQHLFPAAFTEELQKRVSAAKSAQKASRDASVAVQAQVAAVAAAAAAAVSAVSAAASGAQLAVSGSVEDQQQRSLQAAAAAAQQAAANAKKAQQQTKRPVNQLANMKLPGASISLCENCHFPCHGVRDYPAPCCFPAEVQSRFFVRCSPGGTMKAGACFSPVGENSKLSQSHSGNDSDQGSALSASPEALQQLREGEEEGSTSQGQDRKKDEDDGAEAVTGDSHQPSPSDRENGAGSASPGASPGSAGRGRGGGTGTPMSPEVPAALAEKLGLSVEALANGVDATTAAQITAAGGGPDQYDERREKMQQLIQRLAQHPPIPDTSNVNGYAGASPQRLKWYFQQYQQQADRVVEETMIALGLQAAVTPRASGHRRSAGGGTVVSSSLTAGGFSRTPGTASQLMLQQQEGGLPVVEGATATSRKRNAESGNNVTPGGPGAKKQPVVRRPSGSPKSVGRESSAGGSDAEAVGAGRINSSSGGGKGSRSQAGKGGGGEGKVRGNKLPTANPWSTSLQPTTSNSHTLTNAIKDGGLTPKTLLKGVASAAQSGYSGGCTTNASFSGPGFKRSLGEVGKTSRSGGDVTGTGGSTDSSPSSGAPPQKRRKPASPKGVTGTESGTTGGKRGAEGSSSLLSSAATSTPSSGNTGGTGLNVVAPAKQQQSILEFFCARNTKGGGSTTGAGGPVAVLAVLAAAKQRAGGGGVASGTGGKVVS